MDAGARVFKDEAQTGATVVICDGLRDQATTTGVLDDIAQSENFAIRLLCFSTCAR